MVAAEIGEGRRAQAQAVEAMLVEAVRRRLDRQMGDALARQAIERAMHLDRIGRGQTAVFRFTRRDDAKRAEIAGAVAKPPPDLPHEMGDRGLAGGAGNRNDGRRLPRIEPRRRQRHRAARVRHRDERHIGRKRRRRALADDGGRSRGGGLRRIGKPVRLAARHRHEHVAARDLAAVRGQAAGLDRAQARVELGRIGQQIGKLHGAVMPRLGGA